MEVLTVLLFIGFISGIFVVTDIARQRYRIRCEQLKDYIRFLESASVIEDVHEGAQWLDERAWHRKECDVQDINYN